MERDSRDRQEAGPTDSISVSGCVLKELAGWCERCSCEQRYHLGSDAGVCLYCGCPELSPDPDSELYDRLRHFLLPELPPTKDELDQYSADPTTEIVSYETAELVVHETGKPEVVYDAVVFLGKVSRGCKVCANIKLYSEFNDSRDPEVPCRLCTSEMAYNEMMSLLEEDEATEIDQLEAEIYENEIAYEEAIERQYMIDQCLRELDG